MPVWLKEKLYLKSLLRKELAQLGDCKPTALPPLLFAEHHQSHAASAFYFSPFERAAVLCLDGVGEWATTSTWLGDGASLEPLWEIDFPHSLGLLYSAFTYFTGFKVNSGEYKLMGLAPYGAAEVRRPDSRQASRSQGGRDIPPGHAVLQLLHWPDDDQQTLRAALRWPAAQAGRRTHAARDGHRRFHPGRHGRGGAAARQHAPQGDG